MDAQEFAEWLAFDQIEPFGANREDQRTGLIASTIVNVNKKPGKTPSKWSDFLPPYEKRKPNIDWRDLLSKVEALNAQLGGEDRRKKDTALDN